MSQALPEWDRVLSAAWRLQVITADAVPLGGTAVALFTGHRVPLDADHVRVNLRDRFDQILAEIESVAGWQTNRLARCVQILGSLDGMTRGSGS